jgi:sulfite reductase alpha subunit-like flavoprotein
LKNPLLCPLLSNTRITESTWEQDVRHVTFGFPKHALQWEPGDVVYIYPRNSRDQVSQLLAVTGFDPRTLVTHLTPNYPGLKKNILSRYIII